jgi:hypothetical protein
LADLELVKSVAHVPACIDNELFPFVALGVAQLWVIVTQRDPAKGDVRRLVLPDVGVDGGEAMPQ